ncbi:MFS transporter [Nocardia exalbida]|uniref:MFS transporter n=1 Tax=Nocardia exalbida TaxID=290231 RepID=UPI000313B762|nr:MFS transporter [Nocardia exalbida]
MDVSIEARSRGRTRRGALPFGIAILVIEGWDLGALGTSGPALLDSGTWGATAGTLGFLGTVLSLGMPFGALLAGRISDSWGTRTPVLIGLVLVSLGMTVSGLAPSLAVFAAGLACTGFAVGALTTLTVTFVAESAPSQRRSFHVGAAQCGVAVGGLIVPFVGRAVLDDVSFQALFLLGILALGLIPACFYVLPSAVVPVAARTDSPVRVLLTTPWRRPTVLFGTTSILVLLLVSGVAVWLPTLLVERGFDMRSALSFTVAFNGGAIAGTLVAALVADRGRPKSTAITCLGFACVALLALSAVGSTWLVLLMSAVAGVGTFGTQNLLNGFIAGSFPPELRGTALGVTMGVGRVGAIVGPAYVSIVTGSFAGSGVGFYALIVPAAAGVAVLWMVRTRDGVA